RRHEDRVAAGGVQRAEGGVDEPRFWQDDAALGPEVADDELAAFERRRRLRRRRLADHSGSDREGNGNDREGANDGRALAHPQMLAAHDRRPTAISPAWRPPGP